MKRLISTLLISGCIAGLAEVNFQSPSQALPLRSQMPVTAQFSMSEGLYYTVYGQKIPLTLRQDTIAVSFKPEVGGTRGAASKPLYLQLQQDLQAGGSQTRGGVATTGLQVEVKPLGNRYALVNLPAVGTRGVAPVSQMIQQQSYVQNTLPVVSRSDRDEKIVLTNEIIVSFEPGLSASQKQSVLLNNNLEVIPSSSFNQNRYLVRSTATSGIGILNVANRLSEVPGVRYATPNFVQSVAYKVR